MLHLTRVIKCEWVGRLVKCESEQHWPAGRRMFSLVAQGPLESAGYPGLSQTLPQNVTHILRRPAPVDTWWTDALLDRKEKMYIEDGRIVQSDSFTTCVYIQRCILCPTELYTEMTVFEHAGSMYVYWSLHFNSFVSLELYIGIESAALFITGGFTWVTLYIGIE